MLLRHSGTTQRRARMDTTALLIAKWIEQGTGETMIVSETMAHLLEDQERVGSVCLTLLNLVAQYSTQSGRNPQGLKMLVDFLIYQMEAGEGSWRE